MSKSLGNGIDPAEIEAQYGADILRLWAASADYTSDVRISPEILKQLSEVYRKIRNTARYILGNLYDFDPSTDLVALRADGGARQVGGSGHEPHAAKGHRRL